MTSLELTDLRNCVKKFTRGRNNRHKNAKKKKGAGREPKARFSKEAESCIAGRR